MSKKTKILIFDEQQPYFQQDWHWFYAEVIRLVPANSAVLDIGCGRGELLNYLRDEKACRVTGLDASEDAVAVCQDKAIDVIECDVEEDAIPGVYDVVIMSHVFEHLIDPCGALKKLRDNLKDDGHLIIAVPNFSDLVSRILYLLGKNVKRFGDTADDRRLGIQPAGHIQFYNKGTLAWLLRKTGYQPDEWSYDRTPFLHRAAAFFPEVLVRWFLQQLYRLPHALFSRVIVVRARKVQLEERERTGITRAKSE